MHIHEIFDYRTLLLQWCAVDSVSTVLIACHMFEYSFYGVIEVIFAILIYGPDSGKLPFAF